MEYSKSSTISDDDDHFFDALDEFPFYDSVCSYESDQSISKSSSISQLEPIEENADASDGSKNTPPVGLHRRRSFSQQIRKDVSGSNSKDSDPSASVSSDIDDTSTVTTTAAIPKEGKYRFSRNLKESKKSSSFRVLFSSGSIDNRSNEDIKEISTTTTANNERIDESITVDSHDSSSNFLLLFAGLIIKAIGFQINLLASFFKFPIWLMYYSYVFVIDPFRAVRHGRNCLIQKLSRIWGVLYDSVKISIYKWLKEHKSTMRLALRLGWGLLWSAYVCFILVSLLVTAFVVSGIMMMYAMEEPIQMKESLSFDYTKDSPVAFVPISSCPELPCGADCREKIEVENVVGTRVIPPKHKLQVTVSLTLPESDYNRNLGIFQVRVDFLSANGKALASSRHPCMLQFRSQTIRLLLTFFKMAPLIAGYFSESQTINIKFRGFTEGDMPTSCLRVIMEQRAEFRMGGGIPEIYAASLKLESKLPLLKRILWSWKKTIFIWISIVMFTMELLITLLCCKPIIIPRVRLRGGSPVSNASQNVHPAES